MIRLKNVLDLSGKIVDHTVESDQDITLDLEGKLTLLPALIDPHVHFRIPGQSEKEDWNTGAKAALAGGITTVVDMPNNNPSCTTLEALQDKKAIIHSQLEKENTPLRYGLYFGAAKGNFSEIEKVKDQIVGIKIFMGSSTGNLLVKEQDELKKVFSIASDLNLLVAVHAEDEDRLIARQKEYAGITDPAIHSTIRDDEAARIAVEQAINLSVGYNVRLNLLHLSTKIEMDLVRQGKNSGAPIFAETTPQHLFLTVDDYAKHGSRVQMNPPIRTKEEQEAVWEAIHDGTIDTIGSDHAPHLLEDKAKPYPLCPSGIPGVETRIPLLLNACNEGRISLNQIVRLCRDNINDMFELEPNDDVVLVDMNHEEAVSDDKIISKCGWSPFSGRTLKGWPTMTIMKGNIYERKSLLPNQKLVASASSSL